MAFLKTMYNIGVNTSTDYSVPVVQSLEKTKDFEIRIYSSNKYALVKYQQSYPPEGTEVDKKTQEKETKANDDKVMGIVWKLMKYTQGENEAKLNMKLIMPVFVYVNTLSTDEKKGRLVEIRVMISLPAEYQTDKSDPSKQPLEAPKPNEAEIEIEVIDEFKCYARCFGGFTTDQTFKEESNKLKESLSQVKNQDINLDDNKMICISYDPPFKVKISYFLEIIILFYKFITISYSYLVDAMKFCLYQRNNFNFKII